MMSCRPIILLVAQDLSEDDRQNNFFLLFFYPFCIYISAPTLPLAAFPTLLFVFPMVIPHPLPSALYTNTSVLQFLCPFISFPHLLPVHPIIGISLPKSWQCHVGFYPSVKGTDYCHIYVYMSQLSFSL
jgi:hypothetical protein